MSVLSTTERACADAKKSENRCAGCMRDVHISDAMLYDYWVIPFDVKNFKDGSVKCSGYLKGGSGGSSKSREQNFTLLLQKAYKPLG